MPSLTSSTGTKFQLPALDLKFGSLTEGTNIPPPPPSPIPEESSAQQQQPADGLVNKSNATNNGTQTTPEVQRNGLNSTAAHSTSGHAASPLSPKGRAPSIRRLFSRNKLNESFYANTDPHTVDSMFPRPSSQSNASIATNGQPRKSGGWFRRLRGSDGVESRRSSKFFVSSENTKPIPQTEKVNGPPPPMIPEFKSLGSKVDLGDDEGSLGSDMFKDIK